MKRKNDKMEFGQYEKLVCRYELTFGNLRVFVTYEGSAHNCNIHKRTYNFSTLLSRAQFTLSLPGCGRMLRKRNINE